MNTLAPRVECKQLHLARNRVPCLRKRTHEPDVLPESVQLSQIARVRFIIARESKLQPQLRSRDAINAFKFAAKQTTRRETAARVLERSEGY